MNIALSTGILIFFLVSTLGSLFFHFKQEPLKPKFSISAYEAKGFIVSLLAISAIVGLRGFFSADETIQGNIANISLFMGAYALPFLLRRGNFSYEAVKLLLLIAVVLLVFLTGSNLSLFNLLSIALGLLVYKIIENLSLSSENRFDDIIPAFIWVAVIAWANLSGRNCSNIANILLSCLSISLLLKLIEPYLLASDKFFAKRIVLSVSGGLALLLILTKILLLPKLALLAAFYGLGLFFVCRFENHSFEDNDLGQLSRCIRFLVLLGVLTLAATRIAGDTGLVVLSAAGLLCSSGNIAMFAGLFWISRLLIQAFVATYVANVTGINLMHAYCSAGQYFGFIAVLFVALVLSFTAGKRIAPLSILVVGLLTPLALIYLVHEEPFASFLIAANVAAIALVSFSPLIFKNNNIFLEGNVLLIPPMMAILGVLMGPLITIGNSATVTSRLQIVSYATGALLLFYLIFYLVSRKRVGVS